MPVIREALLDEQAAWRAGFFAHSIQYLLHRLGLKR
jgi:hypothetical protein